LVARFYGFHLYPTITCLGLRALLLLLNIFKSKQKGQKKITYLIFPHEERKPWKSEHNNNSKYDFFPNLGDFTLSGVFS
jgi:hypothetical protein